MLVPLEIDIGTTLTTFMRIARRAYLVNVIHRADGHLTRAARLAGYNRTAFAKLVSDAQLNEYAREIREDRAEFLRVRSGALAR